MRSANVFTEHACKNAFHKVNCVNPGLTKGTRTKARMATRVRACLAHLALEGKRGPRMCASIEQTRGRACLVLRQAGSGAAVAEMLLSGLELVDIGEGRVLIVPDLEPSELTMDGVGFLTLKDPEDFWDMVHRTRTAIHRDIWGGKLQSARTPSTRAPSHPRRGRRLPAIPEVPRAEAAGAECERARARRRSADASTREQDLTGVPTRPRSGF
jgi:hypothetical protein